MSMAWKDIWNRYFFFKNTNPEDDIPPSLTSNISEPQPQDYDINFHNQARAMMDDEGNNLSGRFGGADYMSWIMGAETSKNTRVKMYREMENNSWVDEGLTEYVSTGINSDEKGNTIKLEIRNEDLRNNENVRDNLNKEFEHITTNVLDYNLVFAEWFREFCLMGEVAVELLVPSDNVKIRTEGIKNVKLLRSEQYVAYHDTDGNLEGFVVRNPYNEHIRVLADKNQIAYVDSGVYDYLSGIGFGWAQQYIPGAERVLRIPRSFMEAARKPYKQLDGLEDAAVITKMSRAPQRLVFNVATGNLPKNKAEQYLQKLINKFRKKLTYNPTTGEVDQGQNVKNLLEDYWFVKTQDGKGTDVTDIGGSGGLETNEYLEYFLNKLWRAMKIPPSRMDGEAVFDQNPGSMSTAEIKFQKYIYFILMRFTNIIKHIFIQHLKIKGIWDHYNLKIEDFKINAVPPSYFTYMKNAEFLEAQFARFANFANNIDVDTPIFARKMALVEGLGWSDEMVAQNQKWLDEEERLKSNEEEGSDIDNEGSGGESEELGSI